MENEKAVFQADENEVKYTPFDLVADRKRPTLVYMGATLLSVTLILMGGVVIDWFPNAPLFISSVLNVLGFLIMSLPIMLRLIPGFGRFVDVGPIYTTVTSREGNYLVEHKVRDYETQYSANVLLTFGKYIIMFILSIIITPITAIICVSSYSKAYKAAKGYADANGIPRSQIPGLNPKFLKTVFVSFGIFFAVIFAVGLATNENYAAGGLGQIGNFAEFFKVVGKAPKEYYGVSENNGWVAAFKLNDGRQVYCGEASDYGEYYVIDGVLYTKTENNKWNTLDDNAAKSQLLNRHLHTVLDNSYEYKSGQAWEDGMGITHTFDNKGSGGIISFSKDGVLKMYANSMNGNCSFDIKESDFTEFKQTALEILNYNK